MEILTKPLSTFSFEDIQVIAQKGEPEGIQLDYKKDFQTNEKTAQLITAFANTRGGIVIVGVGENRSTGIPETWEGIDEGRHEERVAQIISGIMPIPAYEVHKTEAVNDKVFVLIRVFEGNETPYYPHNDSNLWIRTGSIKKSIDIASPETAELLFKKGEKASLLRLQNENKAVLNYQSFLKFAEKTRLLEIEAEKRDYITRKGLLEDGDRMPPFISKIEQDAIGSNSAMLTILLQPYYPHGDFVRPREIESLIRESYSNNNFYSFPILSDWQSIPNGTIHFSGQGDVICQQVFSNGLVYGIHNILRTVQGIPTTHLGWLTGELYITLMGAKNVWERLGYQGTLVGTISVSGLSRVIVEPIVGSFRGGNPSTFQEHSWSLKIDTQTLLDIEKMRDYVTDVTKDIHWSFGYKNYLEQLTKEYLLAKSYLQ